jgi:ferredoxin
MSLKDTLIGLRCILLRYNPIRHDICLIKSGNPDRNSPVLVSGNYFHTVKRLQKAVDGIDCYILVACSAGINAWCAAGVCDFNEHKIADAVHATDLIDFVDHRQLILPQLAAVGIDLKKLQEECDFRGIWGPASMFDIPEFIKAGKKATKEMRIARFPLFDRLCNAIGMFGVFLFIPILALIIGYLTYGQNTGIAAAHLFLGLNFVNIFGIFLLYNVLPFKYPSNNALIIGITTIIYILVEGLVLRNSQPGIVGLKILAAIIINLIVAIDMLGSTPFYKTTIAHWFTTLDNKSLFQPEITDACTSCGKCLKVCPKGLFSMEDKKMVVDLSLECCECLACIKQCPVNAIVNLNGEIFKDDIKSFADLSEVMRPRPAQCRENDNQRIQ